jgi:hypothetical protein
MIGIQNFRESSDSQILEEMSALLNERRVANVYSYLPAVSFYQLELTRRTVIRLRESSGRLETLTKALIGATVILLVAAMPAAIEIITRWCSR